MALIILLAQLVGCAPGPSPLPPAPPPANSPYRISPGDVLEVLVWREPEVSGPVTVRSDGMVSVALVGDVTATGRTPEELAAEIRHRLLQFIENPHVVVRVVSSGRRYYMVGNIGAPGMYELRPGQTLIQAIAVAGGFTPFAKRGQVRIIRRGSSGPTYDCDAIVSGEQPDVSLEPNDTIIVP